MGLDTTIRPLAVHLLWKMAATIQCTRNQALHGATKTESEYRQKQQLDNNIQQLLQVLNEHEIAHRAVPLGYSFTIDSKKALIRWKT